MPIHDWTRVAAGTFHHFHQTWIVEISRALNAGRLPAGYYAMAEQIVGGLGPDVLTLEGPSSGEERPGELESAGGLATLTVAAKPPKVQIHATAEIDQYARKASEIAIRHSSDHKVVAIIEIVSPGNKHSRHALSRFLSKAAEMLDAGVHLLIVDLFPPGTFDPNGLHAAIWEEYTGEAFAPPAGKPLTLAAYIGGASEAYVEPTAIGLELADMPLFLNPDEYVPTPLQMTYDSAWEAVPSVWRKALAGGS
ncbi:MAG TPA: DUF4058 family protein [Tepidisphaeraceae bacterium]|jgi:hypothetical protein|nr:DUF4058 family protein [Tepidisphaeraceae bacterium]